MSDEAAEIESHELHETKRKRSCEVSFLKSGRGRGGNALVGGDDVSLSAVKVRPSKAEVLANLSSQNNKLKISVGSNVKKEKGRKGKGREDARRGWSKRR